MAARRILFYGVTGSGKSTLARRAAAATGLPWHEVDQLTFEPGWRTVPDEEQRRRIEAVCATDRWILDSAYGRWLDVPLARVELVVCLDYPRWVSFSRLLRRSLARLIDKRPVCNGNRETLRALFSRESILRWHLRSFGRKRARMRAWEAAPPPRVQVLRFVHPRDAEAWVRRLEPVSAPPSAADLGAAGNKPAPELGSG